MEDWKDGWMDGWMKEIMDTEDFVYAQAMRHRH